MIDSANLISVSDASKLGISGLLQQVEHGHEPVIMRNNKPIAAVISVDRLERLQQLEDDLADLTLATARLLGTSDRRTSLDNMLSVLGYKREQIED